MSLILSIETGTDICSVALAKGGRLISLRESEEGRNHAQNLALFIKEILEENRLSADELDAVAVGEGPGSYTGLRIGVSMAKGICYACGVPLIAVGSLQSLAVAALEDYDAGLLDIDRIEGSVLCPMIDARRMEVYAGLFDTSVRALADVKAYVIEKDSFSEYGNVPHFVIFGNGAAKCKDIIGLPNLAYCHVAPSARGMVRLAQEAFDRGEFQDVAYFEPFYLKDFVAGVSKKNILKK